MTSNQIVQKLWNYCNILRDDGLSYGDYVEQLTFLLFLKMADERTRPPFEEKSIIPKEFAWPTLISKDGDAVEVHYRHVLESLGKKRGMLGIIFRKAQNKIQDPAKLKRLISDLIDHEQWTSLKADVKGDAYEGLLEKNAQDTKGGAGQYFTPRPLIQAIVDCVRPQPGETICDPACGTGGFLLAAHDYISANNKNLDKRQKKALKLETLHGIELVDGVARLCAMNLLLHGVGPEGDEAEPPIAVDDSLRARPRRPVPGRANQSAIRQEVQRAGGERGRRRGTAGAHRRPRRLLDFDQQQATEFRPAREDTARDQWPCGGGGAG
jgi:type I restriction enzyme M protein